MSIITKSIYILTLIVTMFGCDSKISNKKPATDNLTNPTPTASNTNCFAPGIGNNIDNYHTFSIVGKGWEKPTKIGWAASNYPIHKNYNDDETSYYLNQFTTDGRFNIRIVARPSIAKTADEYNNNCKNQYRNYTKLQVKIRVKATNSRNFQDHIFDNIPLDGCSEVHEYKNIATNDPIDIQVMAVNWDYDCTILEEYRDCASEQSPQCQNACPWKHVNEDSCYQLEIQLSTSNTKDIPH